MNKRPIPYCTALLALMTLAYSSYVAIDISGSLFGKVKIVQLEHYGGIRLQHLANFEIWRLFAAQIIHVKAAHMLFNVLSFLFLGWLVERHIGSWRLFGVWFIGGG